VRALFELAGDAERAAAAAGLRYVGDHEPGIRRVRAGRSSFRYRDPAGRPVRGAAERARIRSLVIPPAWKDVWICPDPDGHIQAIGRDARGRKQYRYHARWRRVRDDAKYGRMLAFGRALPAIRARIGRDLRRPGLPRVKVIAAVARLLEKTLIRVGNEEYARDNGSFGLTTLQKRHVTLSGDTLRFRFQGKSGKGHRVVVRDRKLAEIVRRCRRVPGPDLFRYRDADGPRTVTSAEVNEYLRAVTGRDFTAKDFRTWTATVLAAWALRDVGAVAPAAARKREARRAVAAVAERLGNTPAICRASYVHPAVITSYLDGTLADGLGLAGERDVRAAPSLSRHERCVLAFLERHLGREAAVASRPAA
jgi:DNA topoisomerase-1